MSWTKKDADAFVIPPEVNVTEWMNENYTSTPFDNCNEIRLAFRTVGSKKHDHYLNRWAAALTRHRGEHYPWGQMCHVELIIRIKPELTPDARKTMTREAVAGYEARKFVKCSVTKKVWVGTDKVTGKEKYAPGSVHCKYTSKEEWKNKYVFLSIFAEQRAIAKALRFCMLNNGMPFNVAGYYANLFVPGGIGVRRFGEHLLKQRRRYFCTEFITTALQAIANTGRQEPEHNHWKTVVATINPATSNPNMMYRLMKGAAGVTDDPDRMGKKLDVSIDITGEKSS